MKHEQSRDQLGQELMYASRAGEESHRPKVYTVFFFWNMSWVDGLGLPANHAAGFFQSKMPFDVKPSALDSIIEVT